MKIAIIGAGRVGGALGVRWAQNGHDVVFGSRNPDSRGTRSLIDSAGASARAASVADAAAECEVVVLAIPWDATRQTIERAGDLRGKIVVDCTNPVRSDRLPPDPNDSAAEQIARWADGARLVKAFNTTGSNNMADPSYAGQAATMFICGDDAQAKMVVAGLSEELDFDTVDTGGLVFARHLETMALLWIHLAYDEGLGVEIAFKLMRR